MVKTYLKGIGGLFLTILNLKSFDPKINFANKRVAIIGAADSLLEEKNGHYIDTFDHVIRINKSIINWNKDNEEKTGTKTTILIHTFKENYDSGGELNFELFKKHHIKYLLSARNDFLQKRRIFNAYKKYLVPFKTFILKASVAKKCEIGFGKYLPTNGYRAIHMVLNSNPKEVYISGITFYKTPYIEGYRDNKKTLDPNVNQHREIHNADLEFENFMKMIANTSFPVNFDSKLSEIVLSFSNISRVKTE